MDFRQIQYFVALYEEKSITKAAKRLHVVQPAVSMQIRRIEEECGSVLFERTAGGVLPNAKAAEIYPLCLDVLEGAAEITRRLRSGHGKISGALSVGVPPSIARGILVDILAHFQRKHPEVQLSVSEGYSVHLVEWLLNGQLDLAILSASENDPRLHSDPILTEEMRVLVGPESDIAGDEVTGQGLMGMSLILPSAKNLIRILLETEFKKAKLTITPEMEIDSLSTVFALVRESGRATILPASSIRETDLREGMRSLRLVEPSINRTLVATFPVLRPPSAAAKEFITEFQLTPLLDGEL
ncbi:MAG: LysR family transcriptional regulator [Rhodobacteraceae bacterium]|jgi:LysR family nitrogen assimilation transcriptional regulator|nr:LysR family transcriptional regulator [Paracoccaceae bacterium]